MVQSLISYSKIIAKYEPVEVSQIDQLQSIFDRIVFSIFDPIQLKKPHSFVEWSETINNTENLLNLAENIAYGPLFSERIINALSTKISHSVIEDLQTHKKIILETLIHLQKEFVNNIGGIIQLATVNTESIEPGQSMSILDVFMMKKMNPDDQISIRKRIFESVFDRESPPEANLMKLPPFGSNIDFSIELLVNQKAIMDGGFANVTVENGVSSKVNQRFTVTVERPVDSINLDIRPELARDLTEELELASQFAAIIESKNKPIIEPEGLMTLFQTADREHRRTERQRSEARIEQVKRGAKPEATIKVDSVYDLWRIHRIRELRLTRSNIDVLRKTQEFTKDSISIFDTYRHFVEQN